ncbi:S66 family peptidase [Streptococcus ruminantium]|uniref:LD-carboxypeptidase n=1 Tax=Streptococcus ruminantium TaxID=1917441 RepID=A0ABU1B3A3_9STRE|nr:S66 peptidase family protein [Streptococcus ruminantium]MDQ8759250.1 LD-carboxypeptidase [Streptococcus ruminantium]MDQ8765335.1 LD-carboxypeptidase [Streptococcus ruminantium]MDQ8768315.1 LD-carboxypeptidase [Streptococcus ruminantium]MDQ8775294.1 LD-carboxypeptidase [Streptococcus ruminantium]MDQ8793365.1 LD-carboxypeptidase [Streptococcus ruminantium]
MEKLRQGNHIRIVSPSSSIERIGGFEANLAAKEKLEELGFKLSFSEHYFENDIFYSSSIASRVADLEVAFSDETVDAIMTTIGGFNCNELLPYLDYDLIARNPKIFCGYSDTTALLNAIYAKTGMQTYMGPAYSSFKMKEGQPYQTDSWLKAVTQNQYELIPSSQWSNDAWYLPDTPRTFFPTDWKVYNPGQASGIAIGGNISTLNLLTGTEFAPKPDRYILFLEEAEDDHYDVISRHLAALLQAYPNPQAVLLGRFPKETKMTEEILLAILDKHPILNTIPVLYDLDFAHTQPLFTITIGGQVQVDTESLSVRFY